MNSLRLGSSGDAVVQLQKDLNLFGERLKITGIYDAPTLSAVQRFQQVNKLQIDGIANRATREKLNAVAGPKRPLSIEPAPKTLVETRQGLGIWENYSSAKLPGVQVVVTARNAATWLLRALSSIETAARGFNWVLIFCDDGSDDQTYAIASDHQTQGKVVLKRFRKATTIGIARNRALNLCKEFQQEFPVIYMVDADDIVSPDGIFHLVSSLVYSGAAAAYGDYVKIAPQFQSEHGATITAVPEAQVLGEIPIGTIAFHASLLPVEGGLFREDLDAFEDSATWLDWFKRDIKMLPAAGRVVCQCQLRIGSVSRPQDVLRQETQQGRWSEVRRTIMEAHFVYPMVSALMLTGKCPERYPFARVAIKCFLDQTWPNKQLVIVNHGKQRLSTGDPRIKEVLIEKTEGITLGDLRNFSIDNADGDWLIQWDDDDWHHPTRMEVQMASAEKECLSTFVWQIRCDIQTKAAFYDQMPGGQHMSILFHRSIKYRYLPLEVREDTEFKRNFKKVVAIDNSILNGKSDPLQYVRFFHGRNIWDAAHVMGGSVCNYTPSPGKMDLTGYHADKLQEIVRSYTSQDDFKFYLPEISA